MKALFLYIILILLVSETITDDKLLSYKSAFEYITSDTAFISKEFKNVNKKNICASNEIVGIKKTVFMYSIVDYESDIQDTAKKFLVIDSLRELESKKNYNTYSFNELLKLNVSASTCNYIIYFSDIIDKQMTAEVFLNDSSDISKSYDELRETTATNLAYYFYLDENKNIKKVFKYVLYR